MNRSYDLHTHSTASDGTLSPTALVARAKQRGVEVLALTDHDTIEGLAQAAQACGDLGLQFVPGVEISVTWQRQTIHILGLRIDATSPLLLSGLTQLSELREWRSQQIDRSLEKVGIRGSLAGARAIAGGTIISRTHFARFLVESGHAADLRKAFKRFLTQGRPGYVNNDWTPLQEAVSWIRQAGGQAVIAHPMRYRLTRSKLLRLMGDFKECGGEGIEVAYARSTKDELMVMSNHANQNGLLASRGSDFHSAETVYTELGCAPSLPKTCTPIWSDWPKS